jgi:hypothetical protein
MYGGRAGATILDQSATTTDRDHVRAWAPWTIDTIRYGTTDRIEREKLQENCLSGDGREGNILRS